MLRLILAATLSCLIFIACSKSGKKTAVPTYTPGYNVYMAGTSGGKVVYWKNGAKVDLGANGMAQAIALNGADVYIGGYIFDASGNTEAAYWKNGQLVQLEGPGISHVYGMAINGTDVYCVGDLLGPIGSTRDSAIYWKDGQRMRLSPNTNGLARSILFAGSDMLISGMVWGRPSSGFDSGVVWKNGVYAWYGEEVNALALSQSDTIIVGSSGGPFALSNGYNLLPYTRGYADGVAVSGTDVYVGGGVDTSLTAVWAVPAYWKNSSLHVLACPYKDVNVFGIGVAGSDVYVGGSAYNNDNVQIPVYWKNGDMVELSDTGTIYAVAVGQ